MTQKIQLRLKENGNKYKILISYKIIYVHIYIYLKNTTVLSIYQVACNYDLKH